MLPHVEVRQFLIACDDGIDHSTLQLIRGAEAGRLLWTSPEAARLNHDKNPKFQAALEDVWIGMNSILCKQPHDLPAFQQRCKDIINMSSDLFRSLQREDGEDLLTAKAAFLQHWDDLVSEAQALDAQEMLPNRYQKVAVFAHAMSSKIATHAKIS